MSARPLIAVFGSSGIEPGSAEWIAAERCGRLLAQAGLGVATGGYGGAMEAVSSGAAAAGGTVVGITAPTVFPGRSGVNAHVTEERPAPSLTERIHALVASTHGVIALPGSIGTFTELLVAWNVAFVARFNGSQPAPVVAVGAGWRRLVDDIANELSTDGTLVTCVASVDEAVGAITAALGSRVPDSRR